MQACLNWPEKSLRRELPESQERSEAGSADREAGSTDREALPPPGFASVDYQSLQRGIDTVYQWAHNLVWTFKEVKCKCILISSCSCPPITLHGHYSVSADTQIPRRHWLWQSYTEHVLWEPGRCWYYCVKKLITYSRSDSHTKLYQAIIRSQLKSISC